MTDRYINRRPTEGEKITRTYRLTPDMVRRIDTTADRLACFQSPLIETLLAYALDELEAGRIQLTRWPVKYDIHVER